MTQYKLTLYTGAALASVASFLREDSTATDARHLKYKRKLDVWRAASAAKEKEQSREETVENEAPSSSPFTSQGE